MASPSDVADALRREVLELALAPGTPLREVVLAERFGCSRRSAREALLRLHAEGLVRHERHRGASVRTFTTDDVRDLYRIRRVLEVEGARSCAEAGSAAREALSRSLEALAVAARDAPESVEHALCDMGFHASVVDLAGSPRTSASFAASSTEMAYAIRLLQREESGSAATNEAVVAEHAQIAHLLLQGEGAAAERAVREHLAQSCERLAALCGRMTRPS